VTNIRVKTEDPKDTGFEFDKLDGSIQDMAKRLGTVIKEHLRSPRRCALLGEYGG